MRSTCVAAQRSVQAAKTITGNAGTHLCGLLSPSRCQCRSLAWHGASDHLRPPALQVLPQRGMQPREVGA
eukprot:3579708-Pyramimonas_sp.AAC.1